MLRWANGIEGKLNRLLIPLHAGRQHGATISGLKKKAETFNKQRNDIVHSGNFMNKREAEAFIANAKEFVETLVKLYQPTFKLKDHEINETAQRSKKGR